jgi:ribosomal protein S18 acetylase RimI-like enzyme
MILRDARLPADVEAILAIDRGFTTDAVLSVAFEAHAVRLSPVRLVAPITKVFPLDDLTDDRRPWDKAVVAMEGERAAGFAAAGFEDWNRRLVVWHFYVDARARGRGLGRGLMEALAEHGRALGATHLWLESSSVNPAGAAVYRRLGFDLCGLDAWLYSGTPAEGETALFFARAL